MVWIFVYLQIRPKSQVWYIAGNWESLKTAVQQIDYMQYLHGSRRAIYIPVVKKKGFLVAVDWIWIKFHFSFIIIIGTS